MSKLFGIPVGQLAVVLAALLASRSAPSPRSRLRNRVFFRLGVRNVAARRGRSALIVVGLMLGTTIIAAALATGDTMSQTIRSSATVRARADGRGRRGQGHRDGARQRQSTAPARATSRRATPTAIARGVRGAPGSSTASRP